MTALLTTLSRSLVRMFRLLPRPAKRTDNQFLIDWLRDHGETNVVSDRNGVGIANNPVRLNCSLYGSTGQEDGRFVVEMEFNARMPDGRRLVEFVGGVGDSLQAAIDDAKLNFVVTTFHVLYRGFINPSDPHQSEETVLVDGKPRVMVKGDSITRSTENGAMTDLSAVKASFVDLVASRSFSSEPHWIKLVFGQHQGRIVECVASIDSFDDSKLSEEVRALGWPSSDDFYLFKWFILIK